MVYICAHDEHKVFCEHDIVMDKGELTYLLGALSCISGMVSELGVL
jgi:hypothetical protein